MLQKLETLKKELVLEGDSMSEVRLNIIPTTRMPKNMTILEEKRKSFEQLIIQVKGFKSPNPLAIYCKKLSECRQV